MKSLERNMGTMWFPKYGSFQIKGTMYFLRLRDKICHGCSWKEEEIEKQLQISQSIRAGQGLKIPLADPTVLTAEVTDPTW